jgi:hypothetical protein
MHSPWIAKNHFSSGTGGNGVNRESEKGKALQDAIELA